MSNIFRVQLPLQYDGVVIASFIFFSFFIFLLLHFHKQSNKITEYSDRGTPQYTDLHNKGAKTSVWTNPKYYSVEHTHISCSRQMCLEHKVAEVVAEKAPAWLDRVGIPLRRCVM